MIVEQVTTVVSGYFIGATHKVRLVVCDFCGRQQPEGVTAPKTPSELRALGWQVGDSEHFCSHEHMKFAREDGP